MRRFYATSTPKDGDEDFLCATVEQALARAKKNCEINQKPYYVAQIIRKVEQAAMPMKVTRITR